MLSCYENVFLHRIMQFGTHHVPPSRCGLKLLDKKFFLENVLYCLTTRSIFWSLAYLLIHNMLTPVDKVLCLSVANKAVFRKQLKSQ